MGGFVAVMNSGTVVNGIWNLDANQIIDGSHVTEKAGIGNRVGGDSVRSRAAIYMRSNAFSDELNNERLDGPWRIVSSINNGYPTVQLSDNADLSAISATNVDFMPAFDSSVISYSATVANSVTSTTVTVVLSDSNATMTINGSEVSNKTVDLSVGTNDITIQVTAEDGEAIKTYTLAITRAEGSSSNDQNNDDYTGGDNVSVAPTNSTTIEQKNNGDITASTTTIATTDSNGKASSNVTQQQIGDAVKRALEEIKEQSGSTRIVEIRVEADKNAKIVETNIPENALNTTIDNGINGMTVSTPIANLTFDQNALAGLASEAGGDIKITSEKVGTETLSEDMKQLVGDRPVYDFSVTSGDNTISQFSGNVTIAVPYTPKEDEDINAIVIYYINSSGEAEMVSDCIYDPITGRIYFSTNHFSQYAVGYNKKSFSDVSENAWYYDAVTFIAARGITTGKGDGTYGPQDQLTRGQFLTMVMRAYSIDGDENPVDNFSDAGDEYYTGYLAKAKTLGLTKGIGDNLFAPEKEITRQEMFTLLYNVLKEMNGLPLIKTQMSITDFKDSSEIASWSKDAITLFVETGIISGSGNHEINPINNTNRAELAMVLYNLKSL